MSWTGAVVQAMREMKDAGVPFEGAWRHALELHPPSGRDRGPQRPTLFDAALPGDGELSVVDFLREACADAWHNRKPALLHLAVLLENSDFGAADDSRPMIRQRAHGHHPARSLSSV